MIATSLALLGTRMAGTACVVVAASLAAERAKPFLGAMIATLPLSAGPAYVFLAADHGPDFVSRSALTSLVGVGGTAVFVVAYAAAAGRRAGTLASLAAGLGIWAVVMAGLSRVQWSAAAAFLVALGLSLAGYGVTSAVRRAPMPARPPARLVDLLARAGTVMALVLTTTLVAEWLGPGPAGYAALMPVVFSSFALVLQPRIGGPATAGIMARGLLGMIGYGPALLLVHLGAVRLGALTALGLALAICLGWNAVLVWWMRERGSA